ncbi:MAG: tRNA pseudouridine(55) synthase TruB [Rhodocyclaceae bacterium]|nr:tRNA pseudouridine(55) synthase TruB [Rhodocyclaceae bacterium]MBX3666987.1 tRNA pseudouridine(55) synthase TruB [Rhodocyclaceae bacterium]
MSSRRGEAVDGVLLLDKDAGITSNAALQTARRLIGARKAGHTGTLDPLASGLLPLCFGEATKFAGRWLDADKVYRAELRLGVTTTTGDAEGEVLGERPVTCTAADVHAAAATLRGEIEQMPPMYSALKHRGRPLYEYARAGQEVERQARRVTIHELNVEAVEGNFVRIFVRCSKGTYIRTLAESMGEALHCGAHLTALRRLSIGPLDLTPALRLAQLEVGDVQSRRALLLPADILVSDFPRLDLDEKTAHRICRGQRVELACSVAAGTLRLYQSERFIGLANYADGVLEALRLLSEPAQIAVTA